MGDWISIILLVLVGLILIYLELVFVPGTTFLGLVGLILAGIGIYIAFETHGNSAGYLLLGGSFGATIIAMVYSFKSKSWDRFALKKQIKSKVNQGYAESLQVEQRGVAISDLKPIGKVEFNNRSYEVTSHGNLIEAGEEVRIVSIDRNKIIVDTLN